MARAPTRYFRYASNRALDLLAGSGRNEGCSDQALAEGIKVSLNLIQRVLIFLKGRGVVRKTERGWELTRKLRAEDYFQLQGQELSQRDSVDNYCIKQLSSGRFRPGDRISELKIAREANVSTGSVREALLRISRFGVIAKDARRQWHVVEWSAARIDQLTEWRLLVERHGLDKLLAARSGTLLGVLEQLVRKHEKFLRGRKLRVEEFAALDDQLHSALLSASGNTFIEDAFRIIWFIIRFQFLNQALDPKLIELGCRQHLELMRAILAGDSAVARRALAQHLHTAADTLKELNHVS